MAILIRHGAAIALAAALCAACTGPADELIVLHTANAYGYFDTCGCRSDSTGGLAKRAWVVDSLRREGDDPILLVDAGDFTGGENAYGAALGRVMIDAMELMEYDAYTLGEWDFNQGAAYVRSIVEESPIAWVHTNYDVVGLEDLGHETLVIERGGRKIGLLGLFNPTIQLNAAVRDSVVVEQDVVTSARRGVRQLREREVDAIVVLSHLSYKADRALAEQVEGIDLIVSGHGGKSLIEAEGVMPGTWVVAPGDLGRFLGRAEIEFGDRSAEATAVRDVRGELIAMTPELPNDTRLDPLFARYEEERQALMRRELEARRTPEYFRAPAAPLEEAPGRLQSPGS
ncbi:MAG: bifunctional UDP-sugar hydrolase/5'-nucleotidase [Gemmatimonadota bacterium]